jgi:hypothetical protein
MLNYKTIPKLTPKTIARFWAKVDIKGEDDCWPWRGSCDKTGYGHFGIKAACSYLAHRVSLAIVGIRSNKLMVLHDPLACNTPSCVNPRHLRLGTQIENGLDARLVGKKKGSKHHSAKLTELDIPIIRALSKTKSQQDVGKLFNISRRAISFIITGTNWKHVIGVATDKQVKIYLKKNNLTTD